MGSRLAALRRLTVNQPKAPSSRNRYRPVSVCAGHRGKRNDAYPEGERFIAEVKEWETIDVGLDYSYGDVFRWDLTNQRLTEPLAGRSTRPRPGRESFGENRIRASSHVNQD